MIDRLSGRLAFLLAAGGVLLIVVVGWFFVVSPQQSKAVELDGRIGDAQLKLVQTQTFLRSSAGRQSVAELRRLSRAIPDEVRMSEILRQLATASGQAGVRIDTITPSALVPTTGGQAVPISVTVEGHYFALSKFLHLLRRQADVSGGNVHVSGRLYAVDGIQFSTGATRGQITATFSLNAFVYGAAPSLTAAGATTETTTTSSEQTTTTTGP